MAGSEQSIIRGLTMDLYVNGVTKDMLYVQTVGLSSTLLAALVLVRLIKSWAATRSSTICKRRTNMT